VQRFYDLLGGPRHDLDYEIDGAVFKMDDIALQDELGDVGREPRWAIAYKFPPVQATTKLLEDLRDQRGPHGGLNPVAILEPVQVGGVIVKQASLHNQDEVERKDVRVGDTVIVQRAGDVIPQVVGPVVSRRTGKERKYRIPKKCPVCKSDAVRPEGEAMAYCTNISCPAQNYRWIIHFVYVMDMEGLGEKWVGILLDEGLIADPADIYFLAKEQLIALPRMGEKLADKVLANIEGSKKRNLGTLLFALGIRHVGGEIANMLADHFGSLDAMTAASVQDISAVEGIGPRIAESVNAYFRDTRQAGDYREAAQSGGELRAPAAEARRRPTDWRSLRLHRHDIDSARAGRAAGGEPWRGSGQQRDAQGDEGGRRRRPRLKGGEGGELRGRDPGRGGVREAAEEARRG
jgi:DNA ligase (NAD+)